LIFVERPGNVAAILMASGFSKRFGGKNKLLIPFRGKLLARYTLELAAAMDFRGGVFFVAARDDVAALAFDLPGVTVIKNSEPGNGPRECVRLGLEAAGPGAEYYLFFPCDMPFLDAGTVQAILDVRRHGCIVEPCYRGRPGNPCLFSAFFREELLSLKENETPRLIKERYSKAIISLEAVNPLILEDLDDEETLVRFEKEFSEQVYKEAAEEEKIYKEVP